MNLYDYREGRTFDSVSPYCRSDYHTYCGGELCGCLCHVLVSVERAWDYILTHNLGFLEGCIIKYITRYKSKGGRDDLLKARAFLDKLIEVIPS
jgi:hypothetical protein